MRGAVENGAMQLKYGTSSSEVKASSIEDIFTGTETTAGQRSLDLVRLLHLYSP